MEMNQHHQTAQILTFPTARRVAAAILSRKAKFAAEVAKLRAQKVVNIDGWYHAAAIEDEARDRGN